MAKLVKSEEFFFPYEERYIVTYYPRRENSRTVEIHAKAEVTERTHVVTEEPFHHTKVEINSIYWNGLDLTEFVKFDQEHFIEYQQAAFKEYEKRQAPPPPTPEAVAITEMRDAILSAIGYHALDLAYEPITIPGGIIITSLQVSKDGILSVRSAAGWFQLREHHKVVIAAIQARMHKIFGKEVAHG